MDKKTSNTKAIFWDLQGTLGGEATEDIERFAPYSFAREALQTAKGNGFLNGDIGKNEIVMAKRAGCKGILVMTGGGKGSLGEYRYTWNAYEADFIANDALEAVKIVTRIACGS